MTEPSHWRLTMSPYNSERKLKQKLGYQIPFLERTKPVKKKQYIYFQLLNESKAFHN
jgi:hypothetical protein